MYWDDGDRSPTSISSTTGEVLQLTHRKSRFRAWIGAIPHWVYFTRLRQDAALWKDTVIWLSGICAIMCIAGIIQGIRSWWLARRRNRFSPYKKSLYRWHHITGFIFGLFAFTFAFSGMMSLAAVPQWLSKPEIEVNAQRVWQNNAPQPDSFKLDYRTVLAAYPGEIKQLRWTNFDTKPCYAVVTDRRTFYLDATSGQPLPLHLTEAEIVDAIRKVHGDDALITSTWQTGFDTYYVSRKNRLDLPVWKITLENADNSCYYINPESGQSRYVNNTARWRHWMYPALHSFSIHGIAQHKLVWNLLMWTTLAGGVILSVTGLISGLNYMRQKYNKFIRK